MIILVFGVSGSGKTTCCTQLAKRHKGLCHLNAGKLISEAYKGERLLRTPSAAEALRRQSLLGPALRKRLRGSKSVHVLVEAHSFLHCDGGVLRIPTRIVASLNPDAFILVQASAPLIAKRRLSRCSSGGSPFQLHEEEIQRELSISRHQVGQYARTLKRPFMIKNNSINCDLWPQVSFLTRARQAHLTHDR
jgi:adenylate kinase